MPAPNSRAATTYPARTSADSRSDGSCGRRPMTKTSTARNTTASPTVTNHTQVLTCIHCLRRRCGPPGRGRAPLLPEVSLTGGRLADRSAPRGGSHP